MRREKISEFCGSGDPLVISSKTTLTIAEKRIAGKISPDTSDDRLQKGINEVKEVEIGELHPYEVCKAEIKSAARGCDTMGAWNLCAKFETLERIVKSLGSNGVMYRSLFCMHVFANVAEAAFFNELLLAKAGLCEGEVDDEILRQIASIISGIRSIVGWKAFQEAVVTNWQKALSSERFRSDPPLYYASMRSGEDRANSRNIAEEFYRSLEKSLCITIRRPCASDFKVSWNYSRRICWKKAKMEKLEVQKKNSHNVAAVDSNSTAISASADEPCSSQSGKKNSVFELLRSIEGLYEDSESIERHVVELLTSARTDDALQGELIDLLGIEQFDLVGALLECRASLLAEADAMKDESKKHSKIAQMMTLKPAKNSPQYCQQVVVQSKMEADLRREARREQKRANKQLNRITHAFGEAEKLELELAQRDIMRQRQLELIAAQSTPSTEGNRISVVHRERYPFVFDATLANDEPTLIINGTKLCVPVGTKRIDHRTYEEVTVPPSDITSIQDVRHIYIKDMDELGQLAFKGYEKLNVIQSIVFEQAYKTRENLLICAPTGAGKTNIALLAILNVVHGYIHKGVVQKDDFKIIYIAPMKALATEMTENFGKRLEAIGLKVRELTGDTTLSKKGNRRNSDVGFNT
uniref:Helicase ATP-binding domain-containing protein n=1 Tax=Parascaris univalens TaxID=6257 RepID=A0A915CGS3_PARUN